MPVKRESSLIQKHSFVREIIIVAVALLLGVALLFCFSQPQVVEGDLVRRFGRDLQAQTVLAEVTCSSNWHLFRGRSESIELFMEFDSGSLLALSRLRASWGPSNVALGLMRSGRGLERDAEPNYTELYWDESCLAAYLNWVQGEVLVSRVEIGEAWVAIYGSIEVAGLQHDIYLAGRPKSNDLGQVEFPAALWRVEGLEQTEQLKNSLCLALSFQPDLSPLAWKVWAKQVVLSPGQMLVYGSSSCCR
jgi:hypothetical protein